MREYYTETYYARILNSNVNDQTNKNQSYGNSQRIHPPQFLKMSNSIQTHFCNVHT